MTAQYPVAELVLGIDELDARNGKWLKIDIFSRCALTRQFLCINPEVGATCIGGDMVLLVVGRGHDLQYFEPEKADAGCVDMVRLLEMNWMDLYLIQMMSTNQKLYFMQSSAWNGHYKEW